MEGITQKFYGNGQLYEQTHYKNGQRHGLDETFHENGQLKSQRNYKEGEWHGLVKAYNMYGQEIDGFPKCYQNDKKVGMSNCK